MRNELSAHSIDLQVLRELLQDATDLHVDVAAIGRKLGRNLDLASLDASCIDSVETYSLLDRCVVDAVRKAVYEQAGLGSMSLRDYEILFHYMLGADDLLSALRRIPHFARLAGTQLRDARMELHRHEDVAVISLDWGAGLGQERYAGLFFNEFVRLVYILEWMIGASINVQRLILPFGAQTTHIAALHRSAFVVEFAGDRYELHFDRRALQAPIVRDLDELQALMNVYPAVTVIAEGPASLSQRIGRLLLSQNLAAKPILQASRLASTLNMSEATMRRKLRDEGSSYGEIRRQCQLQMACHLLRQDNWSIAAIGCRIGFNDEAAFRRAFKSWTGESPSAWRASQAGSGEEPVTSTRDIRERAI
jgi:AraC-like DNA-binding protein